MKKYIIMILALFIAGCAGTEKTEEKPKLQTTINTLVDITDARTLKLWPKLNPLLRLYRSNEFPGQACKFSLSAISDLKTNATYQAFLPDATETEKDNIHDDIQWRSRVIKKYYGDVRNTLARFYEENDTSINRNHSEVWETIARNLEALAKEPPGKKYLVIFSDLQELSLAGNAYRVFNAMPLEAIIKKLTETHRIPEGITDIQVILVYQPTDRADDLRFNNMVKLYNQMLGAKGAVVTSQATVDQY